MVTRDDLEKAFLADAFPRQGRSVRSSDDDRGHLVDQVAALLSEAPKAFHREGGKFIDTLVEGHLLSRSSVVSALARLRLEAANPYRLALPARMWPTACGSAYVTSSMNRFVEILRRRSISEASPLDYDVRSEVP